MSKATITDIGDGWVHVEVDGKQALLGPDAQAAIERLSKEPVKPAVPQSEFEAYLQKFFI